MLPTRPRALPDPDDHGRLYALLAGLVILSLLIALTAVSCSQSRRVATYQDQLDERTALLEQAQEYGEMLTTERDHLAAEVESMGDAIVVMESEVESATAALKAVEEDNEALKARLRAAESDSPAPSRSSGGEARNAPESVSGAVWSRAQVEAALREACAYHSIPEGERDALVAKGLSIAYKESTYRTSARNGQYLGLFQFGSAWGSEAQRLDPTWSCRRYVKAYADGGWANIRRHWAATY